MRKILILIALSLFSANCFAQTWDGGFGAGDLNMHKYTIKFHEADANPASSASHEIKLFSKNTGAGTLLYFIDSSGNVHLLNSAIVEFGTSSGGGLTFLGRDLTFLGKTLTFTP